MDRTDLRILQELQRDARISNTELADKVGLTPAPCLRRVRQLRNDGVITRYVALVDPTAVGLELDAFVSVTLDRQHKPVAEAFEAAVGQQPEIQECYLLAGPTDYLLRVKAADLSSYQRWLWEGIVQVDGIANIQSSISMRRAKYTTELPIEA
jgi:Lrp/AsnC family leucine-responsive transcriptional regulator